MKKFNHKNGKIEIEYTGLDKFLKEILDVAKKYLNFDNHDKKTRKLIGSRILSAIYGKESIRGFSHIGQATRSEEIFQDIFKKFNEIHDSYENLLDCAVYVKQYPNYKSYATRGITKTKYLRYHIEKYFEEMYILRERIDVLIGRLAKFYKKDTKALGILKDLKKEILMPLEGIIRTRGIHTHHKRYDDDDLARLNLLELLCSSKDPKMKVLKKYKDSSVYRDVRNKWHKIINKNNENTKNILDSFFDVIYLMVFNTNGEIILK